MKYLNDLDFKNKRVLVRTDFNVPVENGMVRDDFRIKLALPTLEYILKQSKSKIVVVSHLGRPGGKVSPEFSLKPVAQILSKLLKKEVKFIADIKSAEGDEIVRNLSDGEIALAENIRFHPEEETNDEKFAIDVCHHFGVFVNDAFSASHRAHATIAQIPRFKPSCAGFLMQKEVEELSKALKPPKRPSMAVIGGAKIETKLPVIENLAKVYDVILLGGKISVEAKEKNMKFSQNVVLPEDFSEGNFDIGPKTIEKYVTAISAASFIVWNGPMGKFEEEAYRKGTDAVFEAIVSSDAWKIAGGGESVEYINSKDGAEKFDFISSGGGAMLEFLSGKRLPGIEALENSI
ncbi:MAG: phosphoglycerate kinase [Candidatus Moranbacteria bacterium]|nr:phosphoglycerate kinase [Candidatus Moranbacteria bacterium]